MDVDLAAVAFALLVPVGPLPRAGLDHAARFEDGLLLFLRGGIARAPRAITHLLLAPHFLHVFQLLLQILPS